MTDANSELRGILVQLDRGELLGKGGVDWALKEILAWHNQQLETKLAEARVDELSGIQLEYGHYMAQTFINGKPITIQERISHLTPKPNTHNSKEKE